MIQIPIKIPFVNSKITKFSWLHKMGLLESLVIRYELFDEDDLLNLFNLRN